MNSIPELINCSVHGLRAVAYRQCIECYFQGAGVDTKEMNFDPPDYAEIHDKVEIHYPKLPLASNSTVELEKRRKMGVSLINVLETLMSKKIGPSGAILRFNFDEPNIGVQVCESDQDAAKMLLVLLRAMPDEFTISSALEALDNARFWLLFWSSTGCHSKEVKTEEKGE